jgi:hypothetical protein
LVRRVIKEQSQQVPRKSTAVSSRPPGTGGKPSPQSTGNNEYGPYCRIGTAQGVIKQHATGSRGPNVKMGETGFGLFDASNKMICMISTKFTNGGTVVTSTPISK